MLEAGIEICGLLGSDIFAFKIDYDEWPGSHEDDGSAAVPYNGSYFNLRY